MKYPKIGQTPAEELVDLTESVREIANRLLRVHDGGHGEVSRARALLDEVAESLGVIGASADTPRILGASDPEQTRPYYFPGAAEPRVHVAHPWMSVEQTTDGRSGRVRFDLIHEGPPGCAHGGHVAWFFDQIFGQHVVESEVGGPTHRLEVIYRKPTPILRELDYEVRTNRIDGRKIFADATLRDGETTLAEASALFVEPRAGFAQPD